ncbi:FAD-dependent oxidoreductase [Mycolicibacterium sp. S2-37]|uniref:NAD(P)/FAD-dependent oxidoreductase n=1 Tax=Mycolicibacterium sp. S2-37 TaxID=2810297 RepID=UPI001A94E6D8|nr:FAD-dependent oxidoreductase [Mycolicibacterium sp. S2-37]MBO0679341.1 FAD-dependent oxidoreductase [Mycolicibacterium sp. S2-37]
MTHHHTRVVVIGGGYAGILAANQLRSRRDVDVTVVNPRPDFVERIRLHQLVAGTGRATTDYAPLLGEGVRLVVDTAARIDTASRSVELASGGALDYDYVVYAVGSTGAVPASVPGAAEFAYPIAELEQAQRVHTAIDERPLDAPVTVVGAGLTGIEVATELAGKGRAVTLVCGGRLGPAQLSESGRRSVAKVMAKLGVHVLETDSVAEVRAAAVVLDDGAVRPSAVTIWTAGFGVPHLAAHSGLRTDALGRLLTDETLTSIDDPRIVAAGDCAAPSGRPLRMCCASATQLGPQAAETVLSRIAGSQPAQLQYAIPGSCTSLGRRAGILQFSRPDDTPVDLYIGGRVAAVLKESICKGTLWGLRRAARKPGSGFWLRGGRRPATPAIASVVPES